MRVFTITDTLACNVQFTYRIEAEDRETAIAQYKEKQAGCVRKEVVEILPSLHPDLDYLWLKVAEGDPTTAGTEAETIDRLKNALKLYLDHFGDAMNDEELRIKRIAEAAMRG